MSRSSRAHLTYRGVVYPWQCDHMGHMNVMWYASKFDEATWQFLQQFGLNPTYFRKHRRGMAALEQYMSFKREVRPGALITIQSRLLELRPKTIRFMHEMLDEPKGEIVAAARMIGVHMNTRTRKSCSFPAEVAARGRALLLPRASS